MKKLFFIILCLPMICNANTFSAWVEMGPNNSAIARVITSEKNCPNIQLDKTSQPMELRAAAITKYPVTSCEMILPRQLKSASILGQKLVLPKLEPQRIVIIGDTGCRIKLGSAQACNDPKEWPFAKIAPQAAKYHPDLVIHLGDYHYRLSACPIWNKGCRNSPYGYNWLVWNADFFTPAAPLLKAAPWVMVRGNHEDCQRAYEGWDRFLDPFTYSPVCKKYSPLYTVMIGDVTLYVMDASSAADIITLPEQTAQFKQYFTQIEQSAANNVWLTTHKPIWNALFPAQQGTLVSAIADNIPDNLNLIIAGHIHQFESLNFKNRPAQLIVGNSGTSLNKWHDSATPKDLVINGQKVITPLIFSRFGFMTLETQNDQWVAQVRDVDGKVMANCLQHEKQFVCIT
ncbi:MAG: metallophosphoesterase [Gammaproteobacteria bacterium]|nr:metallophosphoesterase [Gammaproteobacteria bacterium]